MKNKKLLNWVIVIAGIVIIVGYFIRVYNNMVIHNEKVDEKWSQVVTDYQRRLDLIPNLVNTVKGYADFEKSTLTDVINARAKATQATIDPDKLTGSSLQQLQQTQGELSSALGRLMVVVERYPELKANQNFLELQAQLEGTENRIANARRKFNQTIRDYNIYIKRFPKNMIARMFGFEEKPYFKAEVGAEKAPVVEF